MTDMPTSRDLAPPAPPDEVLDIPDGLVLGIDFEEFYLFFGGGMRLLHVGVGIDAAVPETYGNKLDRIRARLWPLPDGADLVRRLDEVVALASAETASFADDRERVVAEEHRLERLLDDLMRTVWSTLPGDSLYWYELGLRLARLHWALIVLEAPPSGLVTEFHKGYQEGLPDVIRQLSEAFLRLMQRGAIASAPESFVWSMVVLLQDVATFHHNAPGWYRTAREHTDAVFTALGMPYIGISPLLSLSEAVDAHIDAHNGASPPAEALDPSAELQRQRESYDAMLLDDRPEAAEGGLRDLLATARRALGAHHPLVFLIRSDLSRALLALERFPQCVGLALDVADEASLHLGDRHPVSARVAHTALSMLILTGREQEAVALFRDRLVWLVEAEADELSDELRAVRDLVTGTVTSDDPGVPL